MHQPFILRRRCSSGAHHRLDKFDASLAEAGYSRQTHRKLMRAAVHFCCWAERRGLRVESCDERTLLQFRRHLAQCQCLRGFAVVSHDARRGADLFVAYLQRRGVLAPFAHSAPRFGEASERFGLWMARHRGLAPTTLLQYQRTLCPFLAALGEDPSGYDAARIRDFVLQHLGARGSNNARVLVTAIRAYLRFLAAEGLVPAGLMYCVPKVPQWRLSSLPRYLDPADVERLIASCDVSTSIGLRDRAILLLLARLGLRAHDIRTMVLADVDWKLGLLKVRGKSRREALLPLPPDAGEALLSYLERGRQHSATDWMFLTSRAPVRPFTSAPSISYIADAALKRAGIHHAPWRGAHLLRHSAATAMLRAGCSLDTIGTVLRHRSPVTTALYAKVDTAMLEQVAQPWPAGASC